jgi:SecD/SecF fusion protein
MTDRRRNLFILLLVAGLLIASAVVIATKKTREGLDLKGGVSLVYQAKPTKFAPKVTGDALQRTLDIMRERVDQLGVAEPEILRSGEDQINVNLPDVKNASEAEQQVGQVAQMFFYDWEKNVLGDNGQPDPTNPNVTGDGQAGSGAGAHSLFEAVQIAAKRPAHKYPLDTHSGEYYGVAEKQQTVVCGPQETTSALKSDCEAALKKPAFRNLGVTYPELKITKVNEGTVIVRAEQPDDSKQKTDQWYVLNDDPVLRGTDIKNPEQNFDELNAPNVTFDFTGSGRKTWQKVTREIAQRGAAQHVPGQDPQAAYQHFAIRLDQDLISVPYIDYQRNPDGIDASNGSEISGGFTIRSAQRLANLLKTGALPLKLELISQSQVSATLGKQALNQGLTAGIVGFAVVALFLLLFYRVLGVIAVTALLVYAVYFFAMIKLIPITLTLPGIAGLILTIGVAADANIVIFERVKEEIRHGRSVAAGIAQGYKRGIAAIIDANVVTFMTAFILFILATAGVKGFAFTLGIGTLVSLFTAVLATQAALGTMGRSRMISHPAALGADPHAKNRWERFDFMGASRWFFSFSGVILVVGALALGGKGLHFGIDFESGTRITAAYTKPVTEGKLRDVMSAQGLADAKIQRVTNKELGNNAFQISTEALKPTKLDAVRSALDKSYGFAKTPDSQSIGPTFGNTVAKSAVIAIIASLLVISAYIALRFEWKYAVPVLIALMHDVLITSGVYALLGREVTTSTVAALLTILGYSLYDTIIVFDRVRENVPRMPRAAFSQIVNRSMSEVLTRSLATTFCTCLPVLALLLFGGETLKDFAFALLVGVVSGAYSSIFIASPVLTHWKEREAVYVRRRSRIREALGGPVPAYAVATQGGPVDVEPKRKERASRRITEPELPGQAVSASEFQEMVRDLHEPVVAPKRDPAADALPEDLVMKDTPKKRDKQKRRGPRNKRHGRAR